MDLTDWDLPDPAHVVTPADDAEWDSLLSRYYGHVNDMPLARCVQVARSHGARTVVTETRYVDLDYRSEHHAYYGRGYADVPAHAHRLHFFAGAVDAGTDLSNLPEDHGYIGYIVIRPVPVGPVSRSMLPPPADTPGVRCCVTEEVGFFGQTLNVTAVPFGQQDTGLGACAHVAAWVCHYTAALRGDVARRPRGDFALQSDPSLSPERALPSTGLTVQQLSDLLRRFDLPPIFYVLGQLPSARLPWQPADPTPVLDQVGGRWDTRVSAVMCRHLNGGYPVLVGTNDHAFVVIGWSRDANDPKHILFIRHDDQQGPYLPVHNPLDDVVTQMNGQPRAYGPWRTLQVPLPPKLWLAPENAERKAGSLLVQAISAPLAAAVGKHTGGKIEDLPALVTGRHLALRTYASSSESFKRSVTDLGLDPAHSRAYRLARLPKHVWVVEVVDRRLRDAGQPCVLGEALVDATSSNNSPDVVAYRLHGAHMVQTTGRTWRGPTLGGLTPTLPGGAARLGGP
jgi:hypothetical protein